MKVQSQSARVRALEAGRPPRVPPLPELARTIWQSKGPMGFYRGLGPNVVRNSIVNASEIAAYDSFKAFFIKNRACCHHAPPLRAATGDASLPCPLAQWAGAMTLSAHSSPAPR